MTVATAQNFATLTGKGLVLVKYGASWCHPCKSIEPTLRWLEKEVPGLQLVAVDVDQERPLATANGVRSIPTLHLYRDGQRTATHAGVADKNTVRKALRL